MHAIATLFDEVHNRRVRGLWDSLAGRCGLDGMQQTPIPHFSWSVAAGYAFDPLELHLAELARELAPFWIRTTSVGIFSGPSPVIYIGLVKDRELMGTHDRLWRAALELADDLNAHYRPENWVPHITLAQAPLTVDQVRCATGLLAFEPLDWRVPVDNLALIQQDEGQVGTCRRLFRFGEGI